MPPDSQVANSPNSTTSEALNQTAVGRRKIEPTRLVARRTEGWQERQLDVVGLHLCLEESASLEERLKTVVWPADLKKWDFIKQG